MAYGEQESPDMAGMGREGAAVASGSTQDGSEGPRVGIALCVDPDALAPFRVDDGGNRRGCGRRAPCLVGLGGYRRRPQI